MNLKKEKNINAYTYLYNIENNLRLLILNKLERHKNWWKDIRNRPTGIAVENIQKQEKIEKDKLLGYVLDQKISKTYKVEKENLILRHEIFYTQLEHLKDIIFYYWKIDPSFSKIFSDDKNALNVLFDSIKHIRNYVMHNIPISETECLELHGLDLKIQNIVNNHNLNNDTLFQCYTYLEVKNNFQKELKSHLKYYLTMDSVDFKSLETKFYDLYSVQSWWGSNIFQFEENYSTYYKSILKLNKMSNALNDIMEIIKYIKNQQLEEKSKNLLECNVN